MNFSVVATPVFMKQARRLVKKFPSLKNELKELAGLLEIDPKQGVSLGGNVYKIRIAVASKGRGKSAGMRTLTYVITEEYEVYLLTLYDKSEMDAISDKALRSLLRSLPRT
jgi:hypothetical protein